MFSSPAEAKEFFISKILEQAEIERVDLADPEKKVLQFTETGTGAGPKLTEVVEEFDERYDSADYEAKISALLSGAFRRELEQAQRLGQEKDLIETYRSAFEVLSKEDHYILIMIDRALGNKLRRKWLGLF